MIPRTVWIALLVAGIGVAAYAGLRPSTPAEPASPERGTPVGQGGAASSLPPGHPPLGAAGDSPTNPGTTPIATRPANGSSLTWTVPARWKEAPNPSTMRLATYRIPHAPSDSEDAEMSVSQAGGGAKANMDRWVGQFDEAGQKTAKRSESTVNGFTVSRIEIEGTFASGNMMGAPAVAKTGWALLGVIVESPAGSGDGMAHFFKLTGPAATVKAASGEVDSLIASVHAK